MTLRLTDVSVDYTTGGEKLTVLDGFSETFEPAAMTAVVGPSGSGKSTLLGVCGALRRPTTGTMVLDGIDVTAQSDRDRSRTRRTMIGYVFQSGNLFPGLRVIDQVLAMASIAGERPRSARARAAELLDAVELSDHATRRPDELSGGQRQRVAIARALIHRPRLLLVDEPTAAVDRSQAGRITELLRSITLESGCITIVATHDPEVVAAAAGTVELG